MTVRDDYPAIAVLVDCAEGRATRPEAVRMFFELEQLRRLSELLAAALLMRGVTAEDCDALDEWLRL